MFWTRGGRKTTAPTVEFAVSNEVVSQDERERIALDERQRLANTAPERMGNLIEAAALMIRHEQSDTATELANVALLGAWNVSQEYGLTKFDEVCQMHQLPVHYVPAQAEELQPN